MKYQRLEKKNVREKKNSILKHGQFEIENTLLGVICLIIFRCHELFNALNLLMFEFGRGKL